MQILIADIRIPPTCMDNLGRMQGSVIMHSQAGSQKWFILHYTRKKNIQKVLYPENTGAHFFQQ